MPANNPNFFTQILNKFLPSRNTSNMGTNVANNLYITDMNADILENIFYYLDLPSLANLLSANKKFYNMVYNSEDDGLLKSILIRHFGEASYFNSLPHERLVACLKASFKYIALLAKINAHVTQSTENQPTNNNSHIQTYSTLEQAIIFNSGFNNEMLSLINYCAQQKLTKLIMPLLNSFTDYSIDCMIMANSIHNTLDSDDEQKDLEKCMYQLVTSAIMSEDKEFIGFIYKRLLHGYFVDLNNLSKTVGEARIKLFHTLTNSSLFRELVKKYYNVKFKLQHTLNTDPLQFVVDIKINEEELSTIINMFNSFDKSPRFDIVKLYGLAFINGQNDYEMRYYAQIIKDIHNKKVVQQPDDSDQQPNENEPQLKAAAQLLFNLFYKLDDLIAKRSLPDYLIKDLSTLTSTQIGSILNLIIKMVPSRTERDTDMLWSEFFLFVLRNFPNLLPIVDQDGRTPLHHTIIMQQAKIPLLEEKFIATHVLSQAPNCITTVDLLGNSPMHLLVAKKNKKLFDQFMELLAKDPALLNTVISIQGGNPISNNTPLHTALDELLQDPDNKDLIHIITCLIKNGADPTIINLSSNSAAQLFTLLPKHVQEKFEEDIRQLLALALPAEETQEFETDTGSFRTETNGFTKVDPNDYFPHNNQVIEHKGTANEAPNKKLNEDEVDLVRKKRISFFDELQKAQANNNNNNVSNSPEISAKSDLEEETSDSESTSSCDA